MEVVVEKTDWSGNTGVLLVRTIFGPGSPDIIEIPESLYTRYQRAMTEFEEVQTDLYKYAEGIKIHYGH